MKRPSTLSRRAQYALVYQHGSTYVHELLVMKVLPNGLGGSRYGYSVSKRLGKAVRRNRIRRQLKEITRQQPVKAGWDIVFIGRPRATSSDFHQLRDAVTALLSQANLLQEAYEVPGGHVD